MFLSAAIAALIGPIKLQAVLPGVVGDFGNRQVAVELGHISQQQH
jgi:hypothetical protein